MVVTTEDYKKFNEFFPENMSILEVFEELDKMDPQEAAPYIEIAYDDFFLMKLDGPKSPGKVFEDDGNRVWIWSEIEDTLLQYKASFYQREK